MEKNSLEHVAKAMNQDAVGLSDEELLVLVQAFHCVAEFFDALGEKYWPIYHVFRSLTGDVQRKWEHRNGQVMPENMLEVCGSSYRQLAEKLKSFLSGEDTLSESEKEGILEVLNYCESIFSFLPSWELFLMAVQELKTKLNS